MDNIICIWIWIEMSFDELIYILLWISYENDGDQLTSD
jgi:hypothetical protein